MLFFHLIHNLDCKPSISAVKPPCCCETQCECDPPSSNPTIRNVRCGDNSDTQIIGHGLDINDTSNQSLH